MLQLVLMVVIASVSDGMTVGTQVRVVMVTHPPRQDIA